MTEQWSTRRQARALGESACFMSGRLAGKRYFGAKDGGNDEAARGGIAFAIPAAGALIGGKPRGSCKAGDGKTLGDGWSMLRQV